MVTRTGFKSGGSGSHFLLRAAGMPSLPVCSNRRYTHAPSDYRKTWVSTASGSAVFWPPMPLGFQVHCGCRTQRHFLLQEYLQFFGIRRIQGGFMIHLSQAVSIS
jgi:hypothetical protein